MRVFFPICFITGIIMMWGRIANLEREVTFYKNLAQGRHDKLLSTVKDVETVLKFNRLVISQRDACMKAMADKTAEAAL